MDRFRSLLFAIILSTSFSVQAQDATYPAERFDNGKMWTFDHPPRDYFLEAYGLSLDDEWFKRAQMSALRLPNCSASFASADGLVATNHHCARGPVSSVVRDGENLLDNGFVAATRDEERRIPNYYADQLIGIEDVTAHVYAAMDGAQTLAERSSARQTAIDSLQAAELDGEGMFVQVVSLYNGAQYSAYTFRRYTDVRLVMTPELQLGFFGGDADNFTYPRYTLDFSLYRVYDENGDPLQTEYYFPWNEQGVSEGDPVFVIGNPGSTFRLETVAQLAFRRDINDNYVLNLVNSRLSAYREYMQESPDEAEAMGLRNVTFSMANTQKVYSGRMRALRSEEIMQRRVQNELDFATAVATDEALNSEYGEVIASMAAVQQAKSEYGGDFAVFISQQPGSPYSSGIEQRGLLVRNYISQNPNGGSAERLDQLKSRLEATADNPRSLDERLLAARIQDILTYFGRNDVITAALIGERNPMDVARSIMDESKLVDVAGTIELLSADASSGVAAEAAEGPSDPVARLFSEDPAVAMADLMGERRQAYQSAFAGLNAQQQEIASDLGRGRFEVYGTTLPPDATFSLRIADGVVGGYEYNGTKAPAFSTFWGMYDRNAGHGNSGEWALPERWLSPPATFDRATRMNFASTTDTIGGNSGSPVVDSDLRLVGLLFDGNIESLSGDFIYTTRSARSINVDVRGILEALADIYDADYLVRELTTGQMAENQ